jgi:hypothetical protein
MMTQYGRKTALEALRTRREHYKDVVLADNSSFPAGSPRYFACIACGMTIVVKPPVPDTLPKCCDECEALRYLGWME